MNVQPHPLSHLLRPPPSAVCSFFQHMRKLVAAPTPVSIISTLKYMFRYPWPKLRYNSLFGLYECTSGSSQLFSVPFGGNYGLNATLSDSGEHVLQICADHQLF